MNDRKNHNSLLFLTTLGVYLGLVLVGGTAPQVFAHGALTRNFEISEEVEVKDDLDKKPAPTEDELDKAIEDYSKSIEGFIKNLNKLRSIDEFDGDWDTFDTERTAHSPCPGTGTLQSNEDSKYIDRWLVPAIAEAQFIAEHFFGLADCLPDSRFVNRNHAKSTGIKLKYDKSELVHELSIKLESERRATALHNGLRAALGRYEVEQDEAYQSNKVLLKHTSLIVSGNQVFIVTRLPRADLEALLASRTQ